MGIRIKFTTFFALLLSAAIVVLSILMLRGIRDNQRKQYEEHLVQQGELASNYVKQTYLMESIKDSTDFLKNRSQELVIHIGRTSGMHVILYNNSGKEIANSRPTSDRIDVKNIMGIALKDKNAYFQEGGNIVFLSPLHNSNNQIGVVQFDYSNEKNIIFYNNIKKLFIYFGILVFSICFVLGYLFFSPLVNGILKLKNITHSIEEEEYGDIILLKRGDELGELSKGIYFMGNKIKTTMGKMQQEQLKLKLAVDKLEIMGKQQNQFIGNVTHEFKTPLTVIKAYADLLEMYPGDVELLREANENISKETIRLTDMIEKVIKLSSLEKYEFELHTEELDIGEILEEVCSRLKGKIQKYSLNLNIRLEHPVILGDRESIMQIFINLIDNAIKYNKPEGRIWVECRQDNSNAVILIKDTGIGIPEASRERIFEPFYRVNRDFPRKAGSTGLGLALVKELVERQQGKIELINSLEAVTTFKIQFPII